MVNNRAPPPWAKAGAKIAFLRCKCKKNQDRMALTVKNPLF